MPVVALTKDLQAQVYDKGNYVSVRLPFELYKGRKKAYGTVRVHFFNDGEVLDSVNGELERRTHGKIKVEIPESELHSPNTKVVAELKVAETPDGLIWSIPEVNFGVLDVQLDLEKIKTSQEDWESLKRLVNLIKYLIVPTLYGVGVSEGERELGLKNLEFFTTGS